MELYTHPLSTTSRAILLFEAESDLNLEHRTVDVVSGESLSEQFLAINASGLVPVLADGTFRLTESSAILKYLAERSGSSAYPSDLRRRARVDERMGWINTNLHQSFGYDLVHLQFFPQHCRQSKQTRAALFDLAFERSRRSLGILDQKLIGPDQSCLCGNAITIADYLGSSLLAAGEAVGYDLSDYPNIRRWLRTMRRLKTWPRVFATFDRLAASLRHQALATCQANPASRCDLAA